jgi:hypothetical protein
MLPFLETQCQLGEHFLALDPLDSLIVQSIAGIQQGLQFENGLLLWLFLLMFLLTMLFVLTQQH